jgi:Leucine-rich repeat (LRR) protein
MLLSCRMLMQVATIVVVVWLGQHVAAKPPVSEVLALQSLYNATNGTSWDWRSSNAEFGLVWNFTDVEEQNPCAHPLWQGITCDAGGSHVLELVLEHYRIRGPLPSDLDQLTELEILNLGYNFLSASLPPSLCSLTRLQALSLDFNELTGPLPECIGDMASLLDLNLESNSINGQLPHSLCNMTGLQYLLLYDNELTGPLPECIGDMASLLDLFLYSNSINGQLPHSLCNMTKLQ